MLLFSEESHMTSTCDKARKVVNDGQGGGGGERGGSVSLMFLVHFDVTCDLLLNSPTATQNLFANYLIKKSKRR